MHDILPPATGCRVVELRRYTPHPGRRDDLITLVDREFVEAQEAPGMAVLGQFRDLDAPDRFVWLRGFTGVGARRQGLPAFYGGRLDAADAWSRKTAAPLREHVVSDPEVRRLAPTARSRVRA